MVEPTSGGVILTLRVIPRASKASLVVTSDGVRARVTAPPVDGEANTAVIALLADVFGIPKRDVDIQAGSHARSKRVRLRGLDVGRANTVLAAVAARHASATADRGARKPKRGGPD